VTLHLCGIALPIPQAEVFDEKGRFLGRVDGYWPETATVGEADGRAKYSTAVDGTDASPGAELDLGERVRRAVLEEKEREDRLRDTGLEMARWSTTEILHRPQVVADRVQAAQRRGDPARFTGHVRIVSPAGPWPSNQG
jgi:hypothetical protein